MISSLPVFPEDACSRSVTPLCECVCVCVCVADDMPSLVYWSHSFRFKVSDEANVSPA